MSKYRGYYGKRRIFGRHCALLTGLQLFRYEAAPLGPEGARDAFASALQARGVQVVTGRVHEGIQDVFRDAKTR